MTSVTNKTSRPYKTLSRHVSKDSFLFYYCVVKLSTNFPCFVYSLSCVEFSDSTQLILYWLVLWCEYVKSDVWLDHTIRGGVMWRNDTSRDSFTHDMPHPCVTWLNPMTWLTVDVWYDSMICHTFLSSGTWRIKGDMTQWYVTWLIQVWRDSSIRDKTRSCATPSALPRPPLPP